MKKCKQEKINFNAVNILSIGSYLPERSLSNYDLEKMVNTSDEWITLRTGIKERRIAENHLASSDLGYYAAKNCLEKINMNPLEIELIIVGTVTPDMFFPSTACLIQEKLQAKNAICIDIEAACVNYIYGIEIARVGLLSKEYTKILVIATDVMSRILDWKDRNTCILFGDGASAAIMSFGNNGHSILSSYLGSDGTYANLVSIPAGGSRCTTTYKTVEKKMHFMKMKGKELFKIAVTTMSKTVEGVLAKANLSIKDIKLFIPHQANIRIIQTLAKTLRIPLEKVFINVHKYGNTSGASVGIALEEAEKEIPLKKGDIVVLVSVGAGLNWGAIVIRW